MSIPSISGPQGQVPGVTSNEPAVTAAKRPPQASLAAAATPEKSSLQVSQQEVETAVKAVNEFVGKINDNLKFSVDHDTGKTIVKVIDSSTQEVIKQFPSEEMMAIAKAMDKLKGLLVQQKV